MRTKLHPWEKAVLAPPHPSDFGIPKEYWNAAKNYANYWHEKRVEAKRPDAQPESEPVAWMDKQQGAFSFMGGGKYGPTWIPLYAAPQVDDYVPLSDGQIYTAYIEASNQTLRPQDERIAIAFARAIERAVRGAK